MKGREIPSLLAFINETNENDLKKQDQEKLAELLVNRMMTLEKSDAAYALSGKFKGRDTTTPDCIKTLKMAVKKCNEFFEAQSAKATVPPPRALESCASPRRRMRGAKHGSRITALSIQSRELAILSAIFIPPMPCQLLLKKTNDDSICHYESYSDEDSRHNPNQKCPSSLLSIRRRCIRTRTMLAMVRSVGSSKTRLQLAGIHPWR